MANPVNHGAHAFVSSRPSSPQAFRNQSYVGHPGFACHRCVDYANAIADSRVHVAILNAQLMTAEREKSEAERLVYRLIGRNETAIGQAPATDPNPDEFDLRRQIFQANSEKDCMKIMLERAWKKIADLSVPATLDSESRLSPAKNDIKYAEDLLLDLLGPSELPKTGHCKGVSSVVRLNQLKEAEETEFITNPDGEEVEISIQEEVNLEPEDLSENSYIFRFVREHNESNDAGNKDQVVKMVRKSTPFRMTATDSTAE